MNTGGCIRKKRSPRIFWAAWAWTSRPWAASRPAWIPRSRAAAARLKVLIDARKKIFQFKYLEQPVAGKDIHLSIDAALQFLVERELAATVEKYQAAGGAVIVLNSADAQILAMASYPDYFPQEIWRAPAPALKNKAISFLYDPGSTFKIVLAAAALENRVCAPRGNVQLLQRRLCDPRQADHRCPSL